MDIINGKKGMDKDDQYDFIFKQAKNDPDVLGLALTGGRGKGFVTEHSDYDIYMLVTDESLETSKEKYKSTITPHKFDIFVHSIGTFNDYASFGSDKEWDRYNFAYVKAQIDKTGRFQKMIDEKGIIPKEKIDETSKYNLDVYINYFYRSMKNHRDGDIFASHVDATESVQWLIAFVFSIEGRVKPYSKYIEWELQNHSLELLPWGADEFVSVLKRMLQTGDVQLQKDIFTKIKKLAIERGYQETINGWNGCYLG